MQECCEDSFVDYDLESPQSALVHPCLYPSLFIASAVAKRLEAIQCDCLWCESVAEKVSLWWYGLMSNSP